MRGGFVPGDLVEAFVPTRRRRHRLVYVGDFGGDWPWRLIDTPSDLGDAGIGAANVRDVRPLVVIDPEDEATLRQVGDLLVAEGRGYDEDSWQDLQAALRSLIADPKPDEPQGLGAVVEDGRGVRWVRAESAKGIRNPWQATLHPSERDTVRQLAYADISAVRVLSEGVS